MTNTSSSTSSSSSHLTFFDLTCLGLNAIVGSGIYLFPGTLAQMLGPASFLSFGVGGICCAVIGLCFAEAASRFNKSGGPYQYSRAAFGEKIGFLVGWASWGAAILSFAAVASAVPTYLSFISPRLASGWPARVIAAFTIFVLGVINYRGLRPGANTTNALTIAKLLPLGLLLIVGLSTLPTDWPTFAPNGYSALPQAIFLVFFAYQGFEVVPVPASESKSPKEHAPLAVLLSLGASALLYMSLQWSATLSTPTIIGCDKPLTEMGMTLIGFVGAMIVNFGAIVSMLGFCAGVALCGPRYLAVLGEDEHLPPFLNQRHPSFNTPYFAILATTFITMILALTLDFSRLIDLSVLTVGLQYLATCLAVPRLRKQNISTSSNWTLPGGNILPLLGASISIWILLRARLIELICFSLLLGSGGIFLRLTRRHNWAKKMGDTP